VPRLNRAAAPSSFSSEFAVLDAASCEFSQAQPAQHAAQSGLQAAVHLRGKRRNLISSVFDRIPFTYFQVCIFRGFLNSADGYFQLS
jgi:hypothetical protein